MTGEGEPTVLLVAAADRGHWQWVVPLATHLASLGYKCELWTHSLAASWVPDGAQLTVRAEFGEGYSLNRMVAGYKWAASAGNSDEEGQAKAWSRDVEGMLGLEKAMSRFPIRGTESEPAEWIDRMASESGRKLLFKRLYDDEVVFVVWERVWCSWVAPAAEEANVPSFGLMPSYVDVFRAAHHRKYGLPCMGPDGQLRLRSGVEDAVPPVEDAPNAEVVYVLTECLRWYGGAPLPPPCGCRAFGAFNPIDPPGEVSNKSLRDWLDGSSLPAASRVIVVITLGSQSALASISARAAAVLWTGCLRGAPRVLALSTEEEACEATRDPAVANAIEQGSLRVENWIQQRSVLAHRNVQACVTHCGVNSIHEILEAGVTPVPLPFFDDQLFLAPALEHLFGYVECESYSPVRKATLKKDCDGADGIARAVKIALEVPAGRREEIREMVRAENGPAVAADTIHGMITGMGK